MAKNKVSEWSNISDNNLDVGGINIADDMPPSFVNDAMREMMAQIRQWQSGLYEEPLTIKGDLDIQGGMTLNGQAGTSGQFLMSTGDGTTPQWGSATIPDAFSTGMIIMWNGTPSNIPTGWALCNGANGTPNLTDKFIVGAGSTYGYGATGGTKDATLVSHNHTVSGSVSSNGAHSHTFVVGTTGLVGSNNGQAQTANSYSGTANTSSVGNHSHSWSGSIGSKGSSATNKNLPPYFALCYIMRL